MSDLRERFPWLWLLHIGIFVVWLPAILFSKRRGAKSRDLWKRMTARWTPIQKLLLGAGVGWFVCCSISLRLIRG
jgi:hypothetical protein